MPPASFDPAALEVPVRPRKLHLGNGLFLLLNPDGSRYWRFSYTRQGRRNTLSVGVFPAVGLEAARSEASALRRQIREGLDPGEERKQAKVELREAEARAREKGAFLISATGALLVELPGRVFALSAEETRELRRFLTATAAVGET